MQFFDLNPRREKDGEAGYVLIAVIFLTLVMLISLAVAAPKMAASIQRDKDLETVHRGEQYKRAIQLYYRQFGRYPTSIDQLVQTNNIRFLRKKYKDPETGKDDWKPVIYGRAHVRPLGFFGQPLAAGMNGAVAAVAMGNMAGGMYAPDAGTNVTKDANGVPVSTGDASGPGMSGSTPGTTAGSNGGTSLMGGQTGSGMGSSFGGGSSFGSGSSFGGSPMGGSPMGGSPMGGSPMGGSTPGMGTPGTGTGSSATSFGGSQGPIVGVTIPLDKASMIVYKKQDHYNKWEFNYDPVEDQMKAAASMFGGSNPMGMANGPGGGNPGGLPGGMGGSQTGTGFGNSSSGFGQSGFGGSSSPSPSPSPTPPTSSPTNPQ